MKGVNHPRAGPEFIHARKVCRLLRDRWTLPGRNASPIAGDGLDHHDPSSAPGPARGTPPILLPGLQIIGVGFEE